MWCCRGAEEETYSAPPVGYPAAPPPRAPAQPRGPNAPRPGVGASAAKVLPIDVPAISLSELNRLTGNFGDRALVGEGSYGRVYRATLTSGETVAVKMFDNGSTSGQSEPEFCEQLSVVSRLNGAKVSCLNKLVPCPGHAEIERGQSQAVRGPEAERQLPAQSRGQASVLHSVNLTPCALFRSVQLAAVAALCVQYEADFRPNMTIVVKALQPLVGARPGADHQ
ncbi:hypothetical protein EJB05_04819, partial [Eragrostis curvula]